MNAGPTAPDPTEADFLAYAAEVLGAGRPLGAATRLYEDLALDSLAVYELLVGIEELGMELDEERWFEATTLAHCYQAFRTAARARSDEQLTPPGRPGQP